MKFRALMNEPIAIKELISIVTSLSKIGRNCVMRISSDKVYFILLEEESNVNRPLVWCELPIAFYFKEYNVASEHNEIYLELSIVMLSQTFGRLRDSVKWLKLKLTNKQLPCITIETELVSDETMQNRQGVYDIPVDVIRHQYWDNYVKPEFEDFHVSIQMPNLKAMKHMVDRTKSMGGNNLIVAANKSGRLTLKIRTAMVTLSAHFTNLDVQSYSVDQIPTMRTSNCTNLLNEDHQYVTATVDIKKFLMFVTGMQLNHNQMICSIVQDNMIKLSLIQPGALSMEIYLMQKYE